MNAERIRSFASHAAMPLATLAIVVAGVLAGLRLAGPVSENTALGRVSYELAPAISGGVEAYVPVADWGLRSDAFSGPFELRLELRTVERQALIDAAADDPSVLEQVRSELEDGALNAVLRAITWSLGVVLVLAAVVVLAWPRVAALRARLRRPRRRVSRAHRRGRAGDRLDELRRSRAREPDLLRTRCRARAPAGSGRVGDGGERLRVRAREHPSQRQRRAHKRADPIRRGTRALPLLRPPRERARHRPRRAVRRRSARALRGGLRPARDGRGGVAARRAGRSSRRSRPRRLRATTTPISSWRSSPMPASR